MKFEIISNRLIIKALCLAVAVAVAPLSGFRDLPSDPLNEVKYRHFVMALQNESTFNYFTVVTVKDLRTNKVKEICTKGNFLSGAVHWELDKGYDPKGEKDALKWTMSKRDRYFEFKNPKSLENISFPDYDTKLVQTIQRKYDFAAIVMQIKATKRFSIELKDSEMKAFAHVLFNLGYMSGESSCFGGTLVYVDEGKQKTQQNQ